jgi:hypothetical protein
MKKAVAFIFALLACVFPVFAEDMAPLMLTSTRGYALGGPHVAYTDDIYALFVNPAALRKVNQGSFFEFSFAVDNLDDLVDVVKAAGTKDYDAVGDYAEKSGGKIPLGFAIRGPLSVGYAANGLGFGAWDQISMNTEIIGTTVIVDAYADVILNFGMSFSVLSLGSHEVDAGFAVKPFFRGLITLDKDLMDLAIGGSNTFEKLLDDVNLPLIAGAGFDLGFMYRWRNNLAAGMTFDDIFTRGGVITTPVGTNPSGSYKVPFTLNMGVAYTLKLSELWPSAPGILAPTYAAFMFDWRDFINVFFASDYTRKNPVLNLGFGIEAGLFNFFKIRMGLSEMLPAVGLGVEFKTIQFNIAVYGKELGNEPGQMSTWALDLSFALRPKTKERSWPWTKPIVNAFLNKSKSEDGEQETPVEQPAEGEAL